MTESEWQAKLTAKNLQRREHVMVDLETMGQEPTAAIVAIGAVLFNPGERDCDNYHVIKAAKERCFYTNVTLASSLRAGLEVDASTVDWWMHQEHEARMGLYKEPRMSLDQALVDFSMWWSTMDAKYIWGHGASFDPVILGEAYKRADLSIPWGHRDIRDTRTAYDWAGYLPGPRLLGTEHNALEDAIYQVLDVQAAFNIGHKYCHPQEVKPRRCA